MLPDLPLTAGVEDEPAPKPKRQPAPAQNGSDWSRELERGYNAASGSSGLPRTASRSRESSRPTSGGFSEPSRRDLSPHDSRGGYDGRIGIHDIAGQLQPVDVHCVAAAVHGTLC